MTDNATPWRLHLVDSTAIIGSDGECIAKVEGDYKRDWQRMEANAALIVRAVNSFDDLVEALRIVRAVLMQAKASGDDGVDWSIAKIDAALTKASAP